MALYLRQVGYGLLYMAKCYYYHYHPTVLTGNEYLEQSIFDTCGLQSLHYHTAELKIWEGAKICSDFFLGR